MTPERYQKILHWLNAHPAAKQLVILLNHWLPAVPFVCYPVLLVLLNLQWFRLLRGGLDQTALDFMQCIARAILVPPRRINEIILGKRAVTADTDLRLARYFGLSEGFFLGLQADYDLMEKRREIGDDLDLIAPRAA